MSVGPHPSSEQVGGLFGQPHRGRRRNRPVARQQPFNACGMSCNRDPRRNRHNSTLDRGRDSAITSGEPGASRSAPGRSRPHPAARVVSRYGVEPEILAGPVRRR